jgi:hypothetical protein
MTRRLRHTAVVAGLLIVAVGTAFAQGGPPWGWRRAPPHGYFSGTHIERAEVDAAVKQTLDKAAKGT